MNREKLEILVVAGETSGDLLGAKIVDEIRRIEPDSKFYGASGPKMNELGVEPLFDIASWAVTGVLPVALAVPAFLKRLRQIVKLADERKPDVVLLIDFPEFNLKLAKSLKRRGHRVIFYVSPQIWAWRSYRAEAVRKYVDLLLSILPFEKGWYAERGIKNVEYVGNPIVDRIDVVETREKFCSRYSIDPTKPIIAMLPGSRSKELRFHLPIMSEAAEKLVSEIPGLQIIFAAAGPRQLKKIQENLVKSRVPALVIEGETHNILGASDAAAISSGTATLEAGIIGTPMAIVYKMSKIDAAVLGPFVNVENVGLINLVARKQIVREFIQNDFTADALSKEMRRLLEPKVNRDIRSELKGATEDLGANASGKAAKLVVEFVENDRNAAG